LELLFRKIEIKIFSSNTGKRKKINSNLVVDESIGMRKKKEVFLE
jgi:hypothetical protein